MKVMVGNVPVELDVDEREMILDAMVIVRLVRDDSPAGSTSASYSASENMDRIVQVGLLHTALADSTNGLSG